MGVFEHISHVLLPPFDSNEKALQQAEYKSIQSKTNLKGFASWKMQLNNSQTPSNTSHDLTQPRCFLY